MKKNFRFKPPAEKFKIHFQYRLDAFVFLLITSIPVIFLILLILNFFAGIIFFKISDTYLLYVFLFIILLAIGILFQLTIRGNLLKIANWLLEAKSGPYNHIILLSYFPAKCIGLFYRALERTIKK